MSNTFIGSDLVQFGFAGFAFVLAGIIFLLIREWRKDVKAGRDEIKELSHKTHDVVVKNTEAFVSHQGSLNGLKDTIKENTDVLRSINGKGTRTG